MIIDVSDQLPNRTILIKQCNFLMKSTHTHAEKITVRVYNFDCSLNNVDNFCANMTLPFTLSLPLAKSCKINRISIIIKINF